MHVVSNHYRDLFAQLRRRPGMFGLHTYREIAAYVNGVDGATEGELLAGFREFLQLQLDRRSAFAWEALVLLMVVPGFSESTPRELPSDQEAAARDRAFDLLDTFLELIGSPGGRDRILREFHDREQGLGSPAGQS